MESITIYTARTRTQKYWTREDTQWEVFARRLLVFNVTEETVEEWQSLSKEDKNQIKDVGGFVGGVLSNGVRKSSNVVERHLLTLDFDEGRDGIIEQLEDELDGYTYVVYSTHSHTEARPRFRLVMPLDRPITDPTEYEALGRAIARRVGIDAADASTYQMERLMYYPSRSKDAPFISIYQEDGNYLKVDDTLEMSYTNWQDISEWSRGRAEKSAHTRRVQRAAKEENNNTGLIEDPTHKGGLVGCFCRVYNIHTAIEEFLQHVYKKEDDTHYSYISGSGVRGAVVYNEGKHLYSFHGTDPVQGQLLNAFDLVRLHLFGREDEAAAPTTRWDRLPSQDKMRALMLDDPKAKAGIVKEKLLDNIYTGFGYDDINYVAEQLEYVLEHESEDEQEHNMKLYDELELDKRGGAKNTTANYRTIIKHDPLLRELIYFDEFRNKVMLTKSTPWDAHNVEIREWTDRDDSGLRLYIEKAYNIHHQSKSQDALNVVALETKRHPIREWILSKGWDGVKRIDTAFIDYLGAADTPLNRAISRKTLCAAVARVFKPGVKYDQVTIFVGREGLGKSTFIRALGQEWYNDSITSVEGKEGMESLTGAWIIEIPELQAMKRSEITATKAFISKTSDTYRPAYGRRSVERPRQCVFFATTNESEFLTSDTGNRRMWIVHTGKTKPQKNTFELVYRRDEVQQLYAEALKIWQAGEPLYLDGKESTELAKLQESYEVEDIRAGIIFKYLDMYVPRDWDKLDLSTRMDYYHRYREEQEEALKLNGAYYQRNYISAVEIAIECLGMNESKGLGKRESSQIKSILKQSRKWQDNGRRAHTKYGLQRVLERVQD